MIIKDYIQDVNLGNIDVVDTIKNVLKDVKRINKEYNYFNVISEELALELARKVKKGKLAGLPISIKDCVCVKDVESTAGSEILKGYKPVFNANVVQRIIDEGGIIIGKTSQDEFGFGSFSVNTKNVPLNPFDKTKSCGGSSGGAAGITQKIDLHLAIAESTGGSIVAPAAFCGVIGFCPTYGQVSRYGLIDYANSLDKIGVMGKDIEDVELLFNVIKGDDVHESTTDSKDFESGPLKIGIIKGWKVDSKIEKLFWDKIEELKQQGIKVEEVELPLNEKYALSTYYLIAMAESSTNLAKYCGLRYGQQEKLEDNFNEYFTKIRSKYFSKESKRRIMIGTFARMAGYRDAYYLKALKVRKMLIEEYKKAFKKYPVLACPTMPILPPKFSEIKKLTPLENYMMDQLTVGPNLAGLPHISLPLDKYTGIMFIANHFNENKLFEISKKW